MTDGKDLDVTAAAPDSAGLWWVKCPLTGWDTVDLRESADGLAFDWGGVRMTGNLARFDWGPRADAPGAHPMATSSQAGQVPDFGR